MKTQGRMNPHMLMCFFFVPRVTGRNTHDRAAREINEPIGVTGKQELEKAVRCGCAGWGLCDVRRAQGCRGGGMERTLCWPLAKAAAEGNTVSSFGVCGVGGEPDLPVEMPARCQNFTDGSGLEM